jgi:ComF family protein
VGLLDLTFPRDCSACEASGEPPGAPWLCTRCLQALPRGPVVHTRGGVLTACATLYLPCSAPAGRLVRAFKYDGARDLARPLGTLLATRYPWRSDVLVVPVPLHRSRLRSRGYNQAVLLARVLARRRRLPWVPDVLTRVRDTLTQTRLPGVQRRRNLAAAFAVRHATRLRGRDVVLLDDVVTTGATVDACAATMLAAGARSVRAYALAFTPAPGVVDAPDKSLKSTV